MFGACHTRGTMPTLNTSKGRNPAGRGGGRASAALPLLDDVTASPPSRRLASARPALAPKCQLIFARTLRARHTITFALWRERRGAGSHAARRRRRCLRAAAPRRAAASRPARTFSLPSGPPAFDAVRFSSHQLKGPGRPQRKVKPILFEPEPASPSSSGSRLSKYKGVRNNGRLLLHATNSLSPERTHALSTTCVIPEMKIPKGRCSSGRLREPTVRPADTHRWIFGATVRGNQAPDAQGDIEP
jgi:hypothetical protein